MKRQQVDAPHQEPGDRQQPAEAPALAAQDEQHRQRHQHRIGEHHPPARAPEDHFKKPAIFSMSASMPMPVRNESVRISGLPAVPSTSVVETMTS